MNMATATDDPSARVAEVFTRIAATRMRDFPLSNPALAVEAVGFRAWEGLWVGVLVAPWSMLLLLMPTAAAPHAEFRVLPTGQEQSWRFPSGEYVFFGLDEAGLGPCQMCSLFSPVTQFATQDDAVAVAREVMQSLFVAPGAQAGSQAAVQSAEAAPTWSRRDFFRGRSARTAG